MTGRSFCKINIFLRAGITLVLIACFSVSMASPGLKQYGQLPEVDMMVISPKGERVAYRRTVGADDSVIVVSLKTSKVVGGIALTDKIVPSDMFFFDENRLVLVVYDHARIPGFRGRHNISTAYVYNIKNKEIRPLLRSGGVVYAGQTELGTVIGVSADHKNIYMPAWAGDADITDRPNYAVFEVPVNAPNRQRVHRVGNRYSIDFFLNHKSEVIVEERYDNDSNRHTVLALSKGEWHEIYNKKSDVPEFNAVGITPDYKYLVIGYFDSNTKHRSYFNMSLETGEISNSVFSGVDADVEAVLTDLNRVVYGVRYAGFNPGYKMLDKSLDQRLKAIVDMFPGNSVSLLSWSDDWDSLVMLVEGSGYSGQYFVFTGNGEPQYLGSVRSGITPDDMNPIAVYNYKAEDGRVIPALLTIPRNRVNNLNKLPAIMLPHGGPHAHDVIGFDWLAQALANEGYLVIQPQFRGSSGFGTQHYLAGKGEWGKKMQSDLSDGIESLAKKGYIDPEKICIVGLSYGGYAALAAGAFTPGKYKCVVSVSGVTDLNSMLYSEKFEHGRDHWVVSYFEESMASGDANRKTLAAVSPARFADNFQAPVLLIHGENDEVVPVKQSKIMYKALKKAKKQVELVELEDEGHHLSSGNTRFEALKHIVAFVNRYLKK